MSAQTLPRKSAAVRGKNAYSSAKTGAAASVRATRKSPLAREDGMNIRAIRKIAEKVGGFDAALPPPRRRNVSR